MRTHSTHPTLLSQSPASERARINTTPSREQGLAMTSGNTGSTSLPALCFLLKPALP